MRAAWTEAGLAMGLGGAVLRGLLSILLVVAAVLGANRDAVSMEQFDPAFIKVNPALNWRINLGPGPLWSEKIPFFSQPPIDFPSYQEALKAKEKEKETVTENIFPVDFNKMETDFPLKSLFEPISETEDVPSSILNAGFEGLWDSLLRKARPWWKGPNVCVSREEVDDTDNLKNPDDTAAGEGFLSNSTVNIQTCHQTNSKYECVQKLKTPTLSITKTVRYQCCSGYLRRGNKDCEKVELLPLSETIEGLNGTEFLLLAKELEQNLDEENLTIFLPSDEAFRKFTDSMLETNQVQLMVGPVRRRRTTDGITSTDLIKAHITKGFKEVSPDEIFESLYNNSSLGIKYVTTSRDEPQFLVNCGRVTASNIYATNGIVHTIDRVLMPVTRSIMEIINQKKNLSTLKLILERTGVSNSLDSNEIWTLFAPTDEAFAKFEREHPILMEKILKGGPCAKNLIKQHMLTYTFCSSAVELGALGVRNSLGEFLHLSQQNKSMSFDKVDQTRFVVNKKLVSEVDIIATNGVIHVIEEVLVPDSILPFTTLLLKNNLTLFYDLVKKSEMMDVVDSLSNFTFMVPTDQSIKNYLDRDGNEYMYLRDFFSGEELDENSKDQIRNFVFYHVVPGAVRSIDLVNNNLLDTISDEFPLRINLYTTMPIFSNIYNRATVDCAKLLHFDMQQCDNIIHQIDRPLIPHNGSLFDIIREDPNFSMLYKVIIDTEIEDILENGDNLTFVAPVNEAFEKLSKHDFDILVEKKNLAEALMKMHVIKDVVCSTGLFSFQWPFVNKRKAINGQNMRISENKIGNAALISTDHMANNGVLHHTNKLMIVSKITQGEFVGPSHNIRLVGLDRVK